MTDRVQNRASQRSDAGASPYSDPDLAAASDRLALPQLFAPPAAALVAMAELPPGGRVLDVGSGTGAVAVPAARAVGPTGRVIALDPSVQMLRLVVAKGFDHVTVGHVPGLPFRDSCFDAVLASFVLSHLANYRLGLEDMVRVLRPGGRIGATAWAPARTDAAELWKEVVAKFVNLDELLRAFRRLIPWDEWFSDADHIARALGEAGLIQVAVSKRTFRVHQSVSDYLSIRQCSVEGTLVRRALDPDRWEAFTKELHQEFSRFGAIEYSRPVCFAFGKKPIGGRPLRSL